MSELNETLFYKVQFGIKKVEKDDDLLWKIVGHIKRWQTQKWNRDKKILTTDNREWTRIKNGGVLVSTDKKIFIKSEYHLEGYTGKKCWACQVNEIHREKGYGQRRWITEIGYQEKDEIIFSCVVTYIDIPGFIGPYEGIPNPSVPKLPKNIVIDGSINCYSGIDEVKLSPIELKVGDGFDFWENLKNPDRKLPYLVITPLKKSEDAFSETVVDPVKFAEALCGNVLVFYTKSEIFIQELNCLTTPKLRIAHESIKIFMPNLDSTDADDSVRHRFFSKNEIVEIGEQCLLNYLRRTFTQNTERDADLFRTEDCVRVKTESQHRLRMEKQRKHHEEMVLRLKEAQKNQESIELFYEQYETDLKEKDDALEEARDLREYIKILERELKQLQYSQEVYWGDLREKAKKSERLENAIKNRNKVIFIPKTPKDVVNYFNYLFEDRIVFSEDAIKSVKTCSLDCDTLWKYLYEISTTMVDIFREGSGNPYETFRQRTGIECASGEGRQTHRDKDLMRQFVTEYKGEKFDIEAHITHPKQGQSIHFAFVQNEGRVLIGHCGEHLNIASTRKVH